MQRGVSAAKEDVHNAIKNIDKGLYPQAFCKIIPDILGGDPDYCNIMHADGAGTKSSLAYMYWRETGDLSVWKGIAQDAIVMNTDDLLCVGATDNILVSSTIGRNKMLIPSEVISAIINGTDELLAELRDMGIGIWPTGGETADVGDLVRTIIVDSTVTCRMRRKDVINNANIRPGDVIVGLSSTGQATYEKQYNGGMGSNGLTSARHDVFAKYLAEKYPESYDHAVPEELVYCGKYSLTPDPSRGGEGSDYLQGQELIQGENQEQSLIAPLPPAGGVGGGAKVLLGTATPSVESYYNALTGKYGLVSLTTRYQDIQLPEIQVVDVKDLRRRKMMRGPFSPQLLAAIRQTLDNKQQVILFQNRRGFAPMVECKVCGWVPHCQNCDVSLTLHRNTNVLTCHYCGYTYSVPTVCPCCGSNELTARGYGTEKIEDQIRELFPQARVARMDLDTTRTRNAYERLIGDFASGKTNVLIGTQMISKGLDFDRVAVVGILDADTMLNYPDFRAYEHAFMMMAQVSGRAGRKGQRGRVLLQTRNKDLPVIRQVVANDYTAFYNDLLEERRQFRYPPFYHLVYVNLRHAKEPVVESAAIYMGSLLKQQLGDRVIGPDKPGIARVKALHLRKIVVKLELGIDRRRVRQCLRDVQQQVMQDKRYASLQIFYDVDPE